MLLRGVIVGAGLLASVSMVLPAYAASHHKSHHKYKKSKVHKGYGASRSQCNRADCGSGQIQGAGSGGGSAGGGAGGGGGAAGGGGGGGVGGGGGGGEGKRATRGDPTGA